jgi:N-acetylglucosamine-6-sulfatase
MNRRQFLPTLAAPVLAQERRPNLLFILIDDLRHDGIGCTGHPFVKTPNIDRIAREGARFTNAFVTTPLCSPARGSYLTGQYVHKHGVTGNGDNAALSHKLVTFPRLLREAGYETGFFGKWHMGMDDSPRPGFDRWVSFRGQGRYDDPPLNIDGQRIEAKGYMTDLLSQHAVDFIRKSRTKPFCAYVAHKAVHGPFTPADRHKGLYSDPPIRRQANASDNLAGKPALTRPIEGQPGVKPGGGSPDELIRNQMRCLTAIDEGVGQMLKALEETGQLDNTLVVFTSDNGYFWGEHGLGDKRWSYDESIRIPMLARFPKRIKAGSVVPQFALNIDIAPTMLDAAGVKPHPQMQGRSLMALFGGKPKWRGSFLSEYFMEKNFPRAPSWQAIRNGEWKYTHYPELQGMDELYHLKADPGEMNNRIADPSAKAVLEKLRRELASEMRATA